MSDRLFIALPLPEALRDCLAGLKSAAPEIKYAENAHLTLRFIGNSDARLAIAQTLCEVKAEPFELRLAGAGLFRRAILWAGVAESSALGDLKSQIDSCLAELGIHKENRSYHPHITLSRLKQAPAHDLIGRITKLMPALSWRVDEFCLYASHLTARGAIHELVKAYPL